MSDDVEIDKHESVGPDYKPKGCGNAYVTRSALPIFWIVESCVIYFNVVGVDARRLSPSYSYDVCNAQDLPKRLVPIREPGLCRRFLSKVFYVSLTSCLPVQEQNME